MKKIVSLVLALCLVLASCAVAFAADPAYDAKISVTQLEKGDVAHFYKIIEWVDNAEGNVRGWRAISPYSTVLTKDVLTSVLLGTEKKDTEGKGTGVYENPTGITAELAGQLARLNHGTSTDVTVGDDLKAEVNVATGTTPLGAGTYMVLITPANADTEYNPVFVSSDYLPDNNTYVHSVDEAASYSDTAAAKKSTTDLNKTASTEEVAPDDMKWTTTAIGDTVTFTVTTTIPGFGEVYQTPKFIVKDQLTDLTLIGDSITVSVGNANADISSTDTSYTIDFHADYLKTLTTPTAVTITYKAKVATTAPLNVNREKNEVSTIFSHDPSDESDYAFKKDTTQHYTFSLDAEGVGFGGSGHGERTSEIVKIGMDNGKPITETKITSEVSTSEYWEGPLAGAHFKLYRDKDCTIEYQPKKADGTNADKLDIVSDSDGRMTISGLDAGKYWIKETEAPAGFVKDSNAHEIDIIAETKEVTITEYSNNGTAWISEAEYNALADKTGYKSFTYKTDVLESYSVKIDGENTATYKYVNAGNEVAIDWIDHPPVEKPSQIVNTKGVELPSTGGIGTTIFYILGGLLVIGAAVILVARRKAQD